MLKKIITATCTLVLVLTLTSCGSAKLINEDVTYELGESISTKLTDYVDLSNLNKQTQKVVLDEYQVSFNAKNIKGKDYPDVGDYEMTFTYDTTNLTVNIHVVDTTKPELNDIETMDLYADEEIDFEEYLEATDLSDVEITVDDSEVDLSKPGEYKLKVTAKDKYENKFTKEIKVTVAEKESTKGTVEIKVDKETENVTSKYIAPIKTTTTTNSPKTTTETPNTGIEMGELTEDGTDGYDRTYYSAESDEDLTGAFLLGSGGEGQPTLQYYPTGELYSKGIFDSTGNHGTTTFYNKDGSIKEIKTC